MIQDTARIHAPAATRSGEWRCECSSNIRAASCAQCIRCGMLRPLGDTTAAVIAETGLALTALAMFDSAFQAHGNRTAAMCEVVGWLTEKARSGL